MLRGSTQRRERNTKSNEHPKIVTLTTNQTDTNENKYKTHFIHPPTGQNIFERQFSVPAEV